MKRPDFRAASLLSALIACALAAPSRAQTPPPVPPLEILDAAVAEYDAETETWTVTGAPVRARRDGTEVSAARIRYGVRDRAATAEGNALVARAGQRIRADRLRADLRSLEVVAEGAAVLEFDAPDGTVTLRAPRVAGNLAARRYAASGGVDAEQPARRLALRADRLDADLAAETLLAEGGVVARFESVTAESRRLRGDLRGDVLAGEGDVRVRDAEVTATSDAYELRRRERLALLRGRVDVRRGVDRLRAPEVHYQYEQRLLTALGRSSAVVYPR